MEPSKAASGARYALAVLFAINLLNFFDRQLPGSLAEQIRREFHLNDTALGGLATVFTLVYAVAGIGFGRATDRRRRTRLVALGTAAWSVLTAASGLAQTYVQLFVTRMGVGIGEATCAPAAQSLVGDFFPPQRRARAMGTFMLGLPAGVCLAYLTAGAVGAALGWRSALLLACLPGLALALLALRIREPERGASEPPAKRMPAEQGLSACLTVLRIPTMWWIVLSGVFHNFNMYAINTFQTPFLQRFHAMSLREASNVSALSLGAVGAIGLLGGGWLADRWSTRRRDGRLLLAACCMILAAPCIFFALQQPKGAAISFTLLMALGSTNMFVYYSTVYAAIQDVIEPRLRGTAVAIYFCAMYVLGASFGTTVTGLLSDHFAHRAMAAAGAGTMTEAFRAAGLHSAMYIVPMVALLAAGALFAASRTVAKDMARLGRT
ncbi:MAG TPA: MFS transporter [Steroidobacteraceae bacterium]|jgi:predicted MFS family arabinose efflux permease|nr:MFS transporter [Steroidobacteraceae bacterium]